MKFDHLDSLARHVLTLNDASPESWAQSGFLGELEALQLLRELAVRTFR